MFDNIGHNDSYRPDKFNRINVLKGKNSRGEGRRLVEEIYQQQEYADDDMKRVHNALWYDQKYFFDYPAAFYQSHAENKLIAVRRIETPANDYFITFLINSEKDDVHNMIVSGDVAVQIPSDYSMADAISAINLATKKQLVVKDEGGALQAEWHAEMIIRNKKGKYTMTIEEISQDVVWEFYFEDFNEAFSSLFNAPDGHPIFDDTPLKEYVFRDVWDRKTLFLHASFVTSSTRSYLGRGGEFYERLGKEYEYDGQKSFYVQLSFDGYHFVDIEKENFTLELAFITVSND
jgi:hypothetical protein